MSIHLHFHRLLAAVAIMLTPAVVRAQTTDTGSGMVRGASSDAPVTAPAVPRGRGVPAPLPGASPIVPVAPALPVNPASTASAASAPPDAGGSSSYVLTTHDVVEVHVFQEDDLLTTARIAQDGTIKFPLVGSVQHRRQDRGRRGASHRAGNWPRITSSTRR